MSVGQGRTNPACGAPSGTLRDPQRRPGPPSMDLPGETSPDLLRLQSEQDEAPALIRAEPQRNEENVGPETSRATLRYARTRVHCRRRRRRDGGGQRHRESHGFGGGAIRSFRGRMGYLRRGVSCHQTEIEGTGAKALAVTVDVGDDAAVERAWDPTLQLGRCRYLVNNAGPASNSAAPFNDNLAISVGSVHRVTTSWIEHCPTVAAALVNISSIAGNFLGGGQTIQPFYPASKAAIAGYTRYLATRYRGIAARQCGGAGADHYSAYDTFSRYAGDRRNCCAHPHGTPWISGGDRNRHTVSAVTRRRLCQRRTAASRRRLGSRVAPVTGGSCDQF